MDRPRISTFEQVMFFDTDCGGVVHNIAYLRFIETNRTHLAETLGMGLREMASTQIFPVVVRTEVDYRKPAGLADKLQIDGWLERIERMRFWVAFTVLRPADGVEILRCRQMLAVIQMPEGKPLRLPADWPEKYGALQPIAPPGKGMR
jgi:YbgC/YbaW family acyl-CoA thioester hydrolase